MTPLFIDFKCLTPDFPKNLDPIVSNFCSCAEPGYQKFDKVSRLSCDLFIILILCCDWSNIIQAIL